MRKIRNCHHTIHRETPAKHTDNNGLVTSHATAGNHVGS